VPAKVEARTPAPMMAGNLTYAEMVAAELAPSSFAGQLIKFNKGEKKFLILGTEEEISPDIAFIALMDEAFHGCVERPAAVPQRVAEAVAGVHSVNRLADGRELNVYVDRCFFFVIGSLGAPGTWFSCQQRLNQQAVKLLELGHRIIPSLLRKGEHPDDVLEFVVNETMTRIGTALNWTRAEEIRVVIRRIMSAYRNLLLKDYDPMTGVIPPWLPGEFHERWIAAIEEGRRPDIGYNRGGFYVRSYGPKTSDAANGDAQKTCNGTKSQKPGGRRPLVLQPFAPFDVSKLPPRSWLYGKHYQRRTVSLTAGPGGMGKTSNDMVEAIAMVTGRNLLGEQPGERLRVWFHNGEDPRDEIDRRLAAICQHFKIPQDELTGWLWTTSGNEFPLRVAKGYANFEVDAVLVRQISAAISDNQIDLAIFDPLVTLHSVSEIDTGKMDAVIRLFAGIADDTDAAIELAHHVRKPAAGAAADYDLHDIRGVAAITDAVRAARVLNRMNERDAEAAGCSEVERLSRFRVDRAKGNYSPAQVATWRQFINVELPNGDDVGVVALWNFPGQGEQTPEKTAADQKAEHVFLQLLDKFTARGANVSANSGPTYAPAKFAEEQEAKTARVSKAALKAAMNRLLDTGRVRTEPFGRDSRNSRRLVRG
jgi:RecA-family ATPase